MRSLFVTALVMAEPYEATSAMEQIEVHSLATTGWSVPPGWYGMVNAAGVGIVRQDGLSIEDGLNHLQRLCSPDPESRSQEYDGRRMARVNGGYIILNYFKYRDFDHTAADRMRRLRARRKAAGVTPNGVVVTPNVTDTEYRVQSAEEGVKKPPFASQRQPTAVSLVARIIDLADESITPNGTHRVIRKARVAAELGEDVAQAFHNIGGSKAVLETKPAFITHLAKAFGDELRAIRGE